MSGNLEELKDALKQTLQTRGVLGDIKARIRAEIFNALDSETDEGKPEPPRSEQLINELIREYLEFQGYSHTLSVFIPESGQRAERMDAQLLAREIQLPSQSVSHLCVEFLIMLFYSTMHAFARGDDFESQQYLYISIWNTDFKKLSPYFGNCRPLLHSLLAQSQSRASVNPEPQLNVRR